MRLMGERRTLILGTAGHIDHGKTALVRALTGVDTDRLPAEKQRGITIDLGFAALDLGDVELGLVDVPGHERFIRNMLAGATGFDLALLIVAADDSVMPQTREHVDILGLLGLSGGVVAVTKCDLVDPSWIALVEEEVRALLAGTPLAEAPIVRTSAATGEGVHRLRATLRDVALDAPVRPDPGPFRLPIDRSFSIAGHGAVVTGTVASGRVAVGDELRLWPDDRPVRVRGLHHHDRPVDAIARGVRAAVNLGGIRHDEIDRGMELAAPGYLAATRVLSVKLRTNADAPRSLRHRMRYRLHLGTVEARASLSLLDGPELPPAAEGFAQLLLDRPIVAVHGQPFVLRAESPAMTLGGGIVLQPAARRLRRRDQPGRDRLSRLDSSESAERALAAIAGFITRPWSPLDLVRETGLDPASLAPALESLRHRADLITLPIGPRRHVQLASEVVSTLEDRLLRALGRLHAASPRSTAVRRERLVAELADLGNDPLVQSLIDRLVHSRRLVATGPAVALAEHRPKLTQAERRALDAIALALRDGRFSPPEVADLAAQTRSAPALAVELLSLLVDEGRAAMVSRDLYLDADADAELRGRVRDRLADGSTLTMADLRDLLGTTRKYAVPIGEYLDRIGLTVREGDARRLAP